MHLKVLLLATASLGTMVVAPAWAQTAPAQASPGAADAAPSGQEDTAPVPDIVVRGIRTSLAKAAQIKENSDQVVDSIVAEDIGKFPDPTVAAALQRVPGVQVNISDDNEITGPIIRGLGDILTTLNGREIFTGTGRGFAFQDLPAEALAGADVYKSNSANMIEGGVAGVVDMRLHRAFDFKKFTVSGNIRGTYASEAKVVNPTLGLLVADRWNTGIGEIGALVDVSYSYNKFRREAPFNDNLRSRLYPVDGADGIVIPTAENFLNSNGEYQRPQANFSLQWRPSSDLEVYTEGLFAGYRSNNARDFSLHDIASAQSLSDVVATDQCNDYLIGDDGFYDPEGTQERLCTVSSFTAHNIYGQSQAEAYHSESNLYSLAGGMKYNHGRLHADVDVSWEKSKTNDNNFVFVIGKPIDSISVKTNVGGGAEFTVPGSPMSDPADYRFAFGLNENYSQGVGQIFAVATHATYDVGGILKDIEGGFRFASRDSTYQAAYLSANAPGGNYATPLSDYTLPADFLRPVRYADRVNDGGYYLEPATEYLLTPGVQDILRRAYGLPLGVPDFQPERGFDATEKTYASYLQAKYDVPLGGALSIDGLVGVRLTRTDRDIQGSGVATAPDGTQTVSPVDRHTSDTDVLPNASARVRFGGGLQLRFNYSKAISRPDFGSLNPGINYTISTNDYILNSGSAGNPDLKPERSNNYDATLEYYFGRNNYLSVGVYYKQISDRVTATVQQENIGGIEYNISRPRNIGSAKLKGLEASGQAFLDFLPGAFSGLGFFGNFTLADSKVTTPSDNLYGLPLIGVSKYSYNLGLLYEKYGLSVRTVYSYRSPYADADVTSGQDVRPVDEAVYLNRQRMGGRVDFGISYDIAPQVTLSLDGTNVFHQNVRTYRSYQGDVLLPRDIRIDETTYSLGMRFTF